MSTKTSSRVFQLFITSYNRQISADIRIKNYKIKRCYKLLSVWLKTDSNPADNNLFRSHVENLVTEQLKSVKVHKKVSQL